MSDANGKTTDIFMTMKQNPDFAEGGAEEEEVIDTAAGAPDAVDDEDENEEETPESKAKEDDAEPESTDEEEEDGEEPAQETESVGEVEFNGKKLTPSELLVEANNLLRATQGLPTAAPTASEAVPSEVLTKYTKEQIDAFKEVATALGMVTKGEIQEKEIQRTKTEALTSFLTSHPEYSPSNDPENKRWNRLTAALSRYNVSDISNLSWALQRAHEDVTPNNKTKDVIDAVVATTKLKRSSVHGGTGGGSKPSQPISKYTPAQIEVMKKMGLDVN